LKCCLNYELETYMEALENIPKIEGPLLTEKGEATLQKTDIFRRIMWFGFSQENTWYPLNIDRVNEILKLNREGRKPATLDIDQVQEKPVNEPLNSDLERMDEKYKNKSRKKKKKRPQGGGNPNQNPGNQNQGGQPKAQGAGPRPNAGNPRQGNQQGKGNQRPQGPPRRQNPKPPKQGPQP